MSGIMNMLLGARTAIAVAVDEFFNRVTLLLPGDGTNGAQNNTFLDSSTNNFTITRNGNTTQGTFSPFSQTGWSNYLDGTGDYLTVADNAVLDMGSSSFTMEFWTFLTGTASTYQAYISKRSGTGVYGGVSLYLTSSRTLNLQATLNGSSWGVDITTTSTVSQNEWVHIAVVRNGNVWTVYINGTSGATTTVSGTVPDNSSAFTIGAGAADGGHNMVACYISNFRLVKGTALYTANFTPSTSPLTKTSQGATASEVELLTCQDNRFLDNSDNAFTITVNGNPSIQAFSPFAPTAAYSAATVGGSGYFDGTGDYLVLPASSAFDTGAGTSDVTFECWVYNNGFSGSQYGRGIFVFYKSTDYNNNRLMVRLDSGSNAINCFLVVNGAAQFGTSGTNSTRLATPFAWTHLALVRSSQTFRLYINGVLDTTLAATTASLNGFDRFEVGRTQDGSVPDFNGNISGFRYLKGTAQYTSAFTPPTAPLTAIANTQLLLNFTNAGITDATAKNDLETVGNAQISTTQSKFGGSSMYFDGTGDYLSLPVQRTIELGSSDWTFETWVYMNAVSSQQSIIYLNGNTSGYAALNLQVQSGALNLWLSANGSSWSLQQNTIGTIAANAWNHIAVVKVGTNIKVYINGTNVSGNGYTVAASLMTTYTVNQIGVYNASSYNLNGYLDDMRLTLGIARYTQNFTAPTSAFALQ
jgi:hypothetical protein